MTEMTANSEMELVTFHINYGDGSQDLKSTIIISNDKIECPMTPRLQINKLEEIKVNHLDSRGEQKSFGLKVDGVLYNFTTKNQKQRNAILLEILNRCPRNEINGGHWETVMLATKDENEVTLEIQQDVDQNDVDHNDVDHNDVDHSTAKDPDTGESDKTKKKLLKKAKKLEKKADQVKEIMEDQQDAVKRGQELQGELQQKSERLKAFEEELQGKEVELKKKESKMKNDKKQLEKQSQEHQALLANVSNQKLVEEYRKQQRERAQLEQEKQEFVSYKANFQQMLVQLLAKRQQFDYADRQRADYWEYQQQQFDEEVAKLERERVKVRMKEAKLECILAEFRRRHVWGKHVEEDDDVAMFQSMNGVTTPIVVFDKEYDDLRQSEETQDLYLVEDVQSHALPSGSK